MSNIQKGWICPKCDQIWAPFIPSCMVCCFTRTANDKYSGDIDPHLLEPSLNKQKPTVIDYFLTGNRSGRHFKEFSIEALKKYLIKNPDPLPNSPLEQDLNNIRTYLKNAK